MTVNILVVSSYPPTRCGIAAYALQQVRHLTEQGHAVQVMSIDGRGDTDYVLDLTSAAAADRSLARIAAFERVILHYAPGLLPPDPTARKTFYRAFRKAARHHTMARVEVVMHESEYPGGWRKKWYFNRVWTSADRLVFHTAQERDRFAHCFRAVRPNRMQIVSHHGDFSKHYMGSPEEARQSLGIPHGQTVFVSLGFFYEGKGFDRAIRVFEHATTLPDHAHYYVVGTARVPEHAAYGEVLKAAAGTLDNVTVIDEFVDDETFDKWITAADCVLLPYRKTWSSGVMARAGLYVRPVIATDVGGLRDQASPIDTLVSDDRHLEEAVVTFAEGHTRPATTHPLS